MRGIVYCTVSERWGVVSKWVMSTGSKSDVEAGHAGAAVPIGPRLAASEHFTAIFKDGMALVERTAAYLDGEGRREAKLLKPPVSVVYATESMRLTTRLLELASWLLIRRAFNEGEITAEEAAAKRSKVKLRTLGRPAHIGHFGDLPTGLQALIEESFRLTDRVVGLDRALHEASPAARGDAANPVAAQIIRLEAAFGRRARG